MDIAEDVMDWMKTHTLRDLTDIALEIEERGENAEEVWAFIRELNGIASKESETTVRGSRMPVGEPAPA